VVVYTIDNGRISNKEHLEIKDRFIPLHCAKLGDHGVNQLICRAISTPFVIMLQHRGIKLISGITGEIYAVVQDSVKGNNDLARYRLPGYEGK